MCLYVKNCDAWRVLGAQLGAIRTVSRQQSRVSQGHKPFNSVRSDGEAVNLPEKNMAV